MRRTAVFLAMLPLLGTTALAAGRVVETDFYSAALDMTMPVQILLPEGYDPGGTSRYPVIYVLHGSGGTHQSSEFAPAVLDDLIASGVIAPTIVAEPNGNLGLSKRSTCGTTRH
jgi:enterochelin esterase-like enzyme